MTLKRLVNISFLALSICLSAYFLFFLSKSPVVQVIAVIFAVMYELGNRYIIAAGRTAWKKRRYITALFMFLFYSVYIVYNILSGAGFFITEIATQDRVAAQAEMVQQANLEKLTQINRSIDTLNRALEIEVETSFRSKSEALEKKIKEREAERDALLAQLAAVPEEKTEEKNPFRDLSAALGIPMERLVGLVWCMVMAGICVILIVTSEELPEEEKGEPGPEPSKPHSVTKRPVTLRRNSPPVTDVPETEAPEGAEVASCACGCGKTFPATPGRLYYDTACRVRDYRRRKKEEEKIQRIKREGVKVF